MSVFYPTITLRRVTEITPELLGRLGVRALILDADNTLTTHNNPLPDKDVLAWLGIMKQRGVRLMIASNNSDGRIRPFAETLGLDYEARACKPLTFGLSAAAKRMGCTRREVAVVGDQIFTDIMGGNLYGCPTILVEPMRSESGPFFRLKRRVEVGILQRYRRQKKKRKDCRNGNEKQ